MKAILEFDMEEPQDKNNLNEVLKATDMRIALWDVDKLFRGAIKYEGFMRDNEYLTDEEEAVVEKLWDKFFEILDERDLKQFVLEMP